MMNLKNMLLTAGLAVGLNACGPTDTEIAQRQNDLKDTFKKEYLAQDPGVARDALEKTTDIDSAAKAELSEEINRQPNDSLYTIDMDRIKNWALGKSKKINHNFSVLLGGKRADSVMQEYNSEILDALKIKSGQSIQWRGFEGVSDVKVPMVYPTLKDFFVPSLKDFLADKPEIAEKVGDMSEVIIVTRTPDGNHVIGYYRDGHIFLAAYMSGGVGKDANDMDHRLGRRRNVHAFTTEGVSYTNDIPWAHRDSLYTSGSFKSSMPYAIPVASQGEFYHIGSLADGKARSHTCRRQAAYVAMIFWDVIGDRKVKNVTYNLYDPEQKTCKHFPKEVREAWIAAREAKKKKKQSSETAHTSSAWSSTSNH